MRFIIENLARRVPLVQTLRTYRRADLPSDLTAGLTTAVMLIPQAMAYAMLAGLPPIIGLYASVVPLAIYALLGTSRELAVGPVAMDSLLVATGVGALAPLGSDTFIAYAIALAGLVGVIQLVLGLIRAGFLVDLLSHPVISGFTSAAALIIGFSQLQHMLGVALPRTHHIHAIVADAAAQLAAIEPATLLLGTASALALVALRRWRPMFPRALAVIAGASIAVWALGLDSVAIVGAVPAGLPRPRLPAVDATALIDLLPLALTIALVAFMEAISVAKALARKNDYEIDTNRELVALGAANIGGSMFGAYPVTGGFSRTAVNAQAGARSTLASLITAATVAIALVLFTPLLYYVPKAVLAAIIMTAVFGLIDVREVRRLWIVNRADTALLATTFAATLSLGIARGIGVGVAASVAMRVVRRARTDRAAGPRVQPRMQHARLGLTLLCAIAALTQAAPAAAAPAEAAWLDGLYERVAHDLAGGAPLVVHAHVPLCDSDIIRCGNAKLGDGDNPATNLYWSTSGGFRGWFGRRGSGWKQVHRGEHPNPDILEVRVWTRRVAPSRAWRARGVRKPFRVYVVAYAWRGEAIEDAMDAYVADLFGDVAREVKLADGTVLRAGGAAHIVSYVGHNGWMDVDRYDWDAARRRAAGSRKGTIAVSCISADYIARDVVDTSRVPLLMTKTLLFAGAHSFEGAVSAFAQGGTLRQIRSAAIQAYATGQGKTVRQVAGAFTNPSDRRWDYEPRKPRTPRSERQTTPSP